MAPDRPDFQPPVGSRPLGRHIHLDLYGCPPGLLRVPSNSQGILRAAALAMRATIISEHFHAFSPHGVSGVIIIAESHLTIHTWPEHGYAAVDVFSCGDLDLAAGMRVLEMEFGAERVVLEEFNRGWV